MTELVKSNHLASLNLLAGDSDKISWFMELYLEHEATTADSSKAQQRRDFQLFLDFMFEATRPDAEPVGSDARLNWTPRLSADFVKYMREQKTETEGDAENEKRRWSDTYINRVVAHLKTFSKWVHKHRPLPLGDPMKKIRMHQVKLKVAAALSADERRRMLDAADLLPIAGGRSKDMRRGKGKSAHERPQRKRFRPWRNRAMIYLFIGSGIRRAEAINLNIADVDFKHRKITFTKKGGRQHTCKVSKEAIQACQDYIEHERGLDREHWQSPALFLAAATVVTGNGRLSVRAVNRIWNEVASQAGVEGRTPHAGRHRMGRRIVELTGNPRAVQQQLGHANASTSMQYMNVTDDELEKAVDDS